jgi:hypothetical protein
MNNNFTGGYNNSTDDYCCYKRLAVKWAKYALQNKKEGLPWQDCAAIAHGYLKEALLIIK